MTNIYKETMVPEKNYVEEDERLNNIDDMENPEEVDTAIEMLDKKIDQSVSEEQSKPGEPAPKPEDEGGKKPEDESGKKPEDESGKKPEDETGKKPDDETGKKPEDESGKKPEDEVKPEDSFITDEMVGKQTDENKEFLTKFKGQKKEALISNVATTLASQSPYMKDNPKAVDLYKEQLSAKSDEELIGILIDVEKNYGEPSVETEEDDSTYFEPTKLELPELPDDNADIQKELDKETLKRLKAKYPNMPDVDDMESEAYKEWRRDLNVDQVDNTFKEDLKSTKLKVKSELAKIIYIKNELPNLFQDSPSEILPILTEDNLPRLKAMNDNPLDLLVHDIKKEVNSIRTALKTYGLTEKDLNLDFTITQDEKGFPYNKVINDLIAKGFTADGTAIPNDKIIAQRGKTYWLKEGTLVDAFDRKFRGDIMTAFVAKKNQGDKIQKDKLKEDTLLDSKSKQNLQSKKIYKPEEIDKMEDPAMVDKIIAEMEKT